jgi:multisubunit Na+/H+ antiporter MnhB subunit
VIESSSLPQAAIPNGSGAASLLAAGIGCFTFAALAFAGDKSEAVKSALIFYKPTGALSGVSTLAIVVWMLAWVLFEWRWRRRNVSIRRISAAALIFLVLSFLLTFPPIVDML